METTTEFLSNTTGDYSISEDIEEEDDLIVRITLEGYSILSLVCLALDILTALVILKYKRLRLEKSNIIILNWSITNVFFISFNPLTLRLAVDFDHLIANDVFCIVEQLVYTVLFTNIAQMVLLTFYWYTKLYAANGFVKLEKHLSFALIGLYIFSLFSAGIHIDACFNRRIYRLAELTVCLSYVAYILFTLIMNVIHAVKKRKIHDYKSVTNIPLIMTNVFCLTCVPMFMVGFLAFVVTPAVYQALLCFTLVLCVMNPIFFFVILYKFDKYYNTFYRHVLSCRCSEYNEELVEQPVVYNNA